MPGPITHLAIANRIVNTLPNGIITNKGLFYAGSIAPDAIHCREGYVREDKKHSHMRDDIADMDFSKRENLTTFHNRVTSFINDNISKDNSLIDLYRGYVVHLLSDEMFLLKVRPNFVKEMDKLGIVPTDILFRDNIFHDLDCHDFMLVKDNSEMKDICNLIKIVKPHCVHGYITEKESNLGINWVIEKYFSQEQEVSEPVYISNNKILTYIEETADNIISRLSDDVMFPKIF
ncbi:zinc dependent phospholipase C family protein [Oceanirhabdus seepicola]|uniref:Zinc dependent phospholipase C family protein n=1 Tax=Oceanirhabdus seepicola TaxID=2828781 RepID=A0A9J6P3Y0_9CLOT|nr:zinc dependent phospholipase C family protein [Oceanirhabdus seepicola]MCM1991407.1 zinc dependent phospholipase C family protein [Oceanirhabdus seepicola]